jgi:hypothetical protein
VKHFAGLVMVVLAVAAQGCVSSSLVLQVFSDGHGRARLTTRLSESSLRAFDAIFPESGPPGKIEEEMPPLSAGELEQLFGQRVRIVSTTLDKAADGAIRTTIAEFDDITKLRLTFPPVFGLPSGASMGMSIGGLTEPPVVRFAMKPHENGDRLLLVQLPDDPIPPDPNPTMTVFETDSREERLLKRALKGAAMRIAVELDDEIPLLRTNAPKVAGNTATIVELDLERLITNLDEKKLRRAMTPGSMQDVLWELGDMPGAVVPVDHEVFLEFQPPHAQQPPVPAPAQPAAPQAPPDTEIYLAPLKNTAGRIEIGAPVDITNSPGYDNQPFFTPDGSAVLFTSIRGAAATTGAATQTDIYRYDLVSKRISQVTNTPESEYSPTITPSGALSVVRVELDGSSTQRLWQFTAEGRDPKVVLENVKPVGYHAWVDDRTLALFILGGQGQPATLQAADTGTGTARTIATDIGRSIQRIPGAGPRSISFVQRERHGEMVHLTIKAWNPATGAIETLTPAVEGAGEADLAWTPDGTLLMAKEGALYAWKRGETGWKEIASLQRLGLSRVTRLAVSPKGTALALVASPPQAR